MNIVYDVSHLIVQVLSQSVSVQMDSMANRTQSAGHRYTLANTAFSRRSANAYSIHTLTPLSGPNLLLMTSFRYLEYPHDSLVSYRLLL